jgi:hypothetical protein
VLIFFSVFTGIQQVADISWRFGLGSGPIKWIPMMGVL